MADTQKPLTTDARRQNYLDQSPRKELTPRQQRRIRKKENKSRGTR